MIALPKPDMLDTVICGDALAVLQGMASNSVDAIVTDPPAGISFMGKDWDNFSGASRSYEADTVRRNKANADKEALKSRGQAQQPYSYSPSNALPSKAERDAFIAFLREVMSEALRVLKPGGHALVWALPRTSHWTALALEDAGFEVREKLYHIFGSGFPKSTTIDKQIDKMNGRTFAERIQLAKHIRQCREDKGYSREEVNSWFGYVDGVQHWEREDVSGNRIPTLADWGILRERLNLSNDFLPLIERIEAEREVIGSNPNYRKMQEFPSAYNVKHNPDITAPATPEAQQWQGWGTATKPAVEEWIMCRKPLSEPTIAKNVLRWGVGALAIDKCRVGAIPEDLHHMDRHKNPTRTGWIANSSMSDDAYTPNPQGRWPSHLLLSHSIWCVPQGVKRVQAVTGGTKPMQTNHIYSKINPNPVYNYADQDGMEEVEDWDCAPDCPIRILGEQSGVSKSSYSGNAELAHKNAGKEVKRNQGFVQGNGLYGLAYSDSGTAARYFTQFPPDSLFAECDAEVAI